jgi:pimeloyl-ACP methyl ester carboxylesterase
MSEATGTAGPPTVVLAYLASVVNQLDGPVLLVGHSYGGAVITNATVG